MSGEWSAKDIEYRVLEAAETLMLTPNVSGPQPYGSAMPATRMEWGDYKEPSRYKRRASAEAITRMMQTWGWINAHPDEENRRLLYAWAWQKTRKGRFLNDFAGREGVNSRTLRRQITHICQAIADRLNQAEIPWSGATVDAVSENETETASQQVASRSRATHYIEPGAKPHHDPESPELKALIKRIETQNRLRARAKKRA